MSTTSTSDRFTTLPEEDALQATVVALEEHGFSVEVAGDLVTDVLVAGFVFFCQLADGELRVFQSEVGDFVGAEVLVGRACRASLDPTAEGGRRHMVSSHMTAAGLRSVTRTMTVGTGFGLLFVVPHVRRRVRRFS